MIAGGPNTTSTQKTSDLFGTIATGAIDDAALPLLLVQIRRQLLIGLVLVQQAVADIGSIKAGQMFQRILQPETLPNVLSGRLIGCRRQRHQRHLGKALLQAAQLGIFRTEIMAPLRDAVRLIDGEER